MGQLQMEVTDSAIDDVEEGGAVVRDRGLWGVLQLLRRQPVRAMGFVIVGLLAVAAIAAPLLTRSNPELADPISILAPPSSDGWFGFDNTGMDVFARVLYGARVDLTIALVVTGLSVVIGVPLGVISGYLRGWLPEVISRTSDVMQSLPVFILAMAIVAARGPSITNVVAVLAVLNSPIFVRLIRSQTYALRNRGFVEAAKVSGDGDLGIIFRHLIPNSIGPAVAQMSVTAGFAILLTAGLSFIGAGVQPPTPEWGEMVAAGAPNLATGEWWPALFPSIAIGVTVFGFALVGETLEVVFNPRKALGNAGG